MGYITCFYDYRLTLADSLRERERERERERREREGREFLWR